jgi:hypothetical protein
MKTDHEIEQEEVDAYCKRMAAEHLVKCNPPGRPEFGPMYRQFEEACIAIYTHHPGNVQGADDFAKFILRQKELMAFIKAPKKMQGATV